MYINFLTNNIPWFGKYSGYNCLTEYLPKKIHYKVTYGDNTKIERVLGRLVKKFYGWNDVLPGYAFIGLKFIKGTSKQDIVHLLHLEGDIHIMTLKNKPSTVIGTIHIPYERWTEEELQMLNRMTQVIVLYEKDVEKFSGYIKKEKISFIHHGVDVNFFKPAPDNIVEKTKVLFVGHYLRNFKMMESVYQRLIALYPELSFHFIIPENFRNDKYLRTFKDKPGIFFYEKLSDEELLAHYQTSYVMMMPMNESGANTGIIQSIAVGLPVITTDVGGIRSYGGGEIFDVVPNDDVDCMVNLFNKYYEDVNYRTMISRTSRSFAVQHLNWEVVSEKHVQLYETLS